MIGSLGRRAFEAVILLFAVLGFAFVPIGRQTALEHLRAILATGAAGDAGRELVEGAKRLKRALLSPAGDGRKARRTPANANVKSASPGDARDGGADASQGWPAS